MKVVFIIKATIRNKRRFYEDLTHVENTNLFEEVEILESEFAGHSVELAEASAKKEYDYIIAVGGDGTLHEVLNGYMNASNENPDLKAPAFGSLPYGTANDFSRGAKLNGGVTQLLELMEMEQIRKIDIGKIDYTDADGGTKSRYFLNIADVGIGAYVVQKVNKAKKRWGANWTFLKAITETFLTYEQSVINVKTDQGLDWQGKTLTLVAANGKYLGSGLCIAPEAKLDNGRFSVVLMGDVSIKNYVFNLRRIKKGKKLDHPAISYHSASTIEITPEMYSCACEADGEFLGYAPLKIEAIYHRINFLLPPGAGS
jgi:diacylglycerol kinase (ATP)